MDLINLEYSHKKAFTITIRHHKLICDMHLEDGGADAGPNPVELFSASLASCIGMIAYEYCLHHALSTEGISLSVLPQIADNPKRIQAITMDLTMPADFPEDRKQAIQKAARQCVISNSLIHPVEIDLEIKSNKESKE
ncbi:OsmC family protein [bacterium]|nr:OsmC family protein [bacterium]